jgi:hypothetical protein
VLTNVAVVPPPGAFWSELDIPVLSDNPGGVFIEKVDGLEPVSAEITTNGYNEQDGEFFVGSRVPKRNVVLHLIMGNRDLTVSQVRRNLYGYFMPKMNVTLRLDFSDRDSVLIDGYVESFEGDRWSQDPDAAVSILCPKPNFRAIDSDLLIVTGDSEYGTPLPLTDVLYEGDRSVGGTLRIVNNMADEFSGDIYIDRLIESSPGVYYSTQQLYLAGVTLEPSSVGQNIWIDTRQGQKEVTLQATDPVDVADLMGKMTDDSDWLRFDPAVNKFRVVTTGTTGWAGNHLDWTLTIVPEYGAV